MEASQSSLGQPKEHRNPSYDHSTLARVIGTSDFDKHGVVTVKLLDCSTPNEVWVMGQIDREPVVGDFISIGYLNSSNNAPYMIGFADDAYMRNFIQIKKNLIRLQLPIFDIGTINGESHKDTQEKLLNDDRRVNRAIFELTPEHLLIQFPTDKDGHPAFIEMKRDGGIVIQSAKAHGTDIDPDVEY